MSGKDLTDVRQNGDLRWLRPDGETQVMIEYVPQVNEVVRSIPQKRVEQRTVEQIVHVPVPRVLEENSGSCPDHSQERISEQIIDRIVGVPVAMQRQAPIIQTVRKTVKVLKVQFID